jgi:hypothetical protein
MKVHNCTTWNYKLFLLVATFLIQEKQVKNPDLALLDSALTRITSVTVYYANPNGWLN